MTWIGGTGLEGFRDVSGPMMLAVERRTRSAAL